MRGLSLIVGSEAESALGSFTREGNVGKNPFTRTPTSSSRSRSSCATPRMIRIEIPPKVALSVATGGGGHLLFDWV